MTGRVLRPRVVVAVALALVALLTASVASASAMSLTSSKRQYLTSASRCSGQTVAASTPSTSGTSTSVVVSNLDASACAGKALVVTVYEPTASTWTAAKRFEATATVAAATATLTSSAFTATTSEKVYVTIGGWPVPATWSYTPLAATPDAPVTPGTNVVLPPNTPVWAPSGNGKQVCVTISVTGTSATPTSWTADLHVNQRPFNGEGSASAYQLDTWNGYQWTTANAVGGLLKISGTGAKATITSSQTYTISVCNYAAPAPAYDPTLTYSKSSTVSTDPNNACITTTVGVTGTYPFYAGWRADVDMSAAVALRTNAGLSAATVEVRTGGILLSQLSGNTYRFTPNDWGTYGVRDAGGGDAARTVTFVACVK
ncbi:hypothetical protein [Cellulomonas rhizosphaerae]|uniref:Ig-like domain-containing protein n=1 Tax=Cellulomonas rhizosphaerae TaxID=2293719 RepID=A0A413RMJ0_9CELL|nr:hypothetical protein [Cellulomonas rhizosphaerae]RHA41971.1 hypothetical protein D1825_07950 [Cellulomonas rhizosphaerae]